MSDVSARVQSFDLSKREEDDFELITMIDVMATDSEQYIQVSSIKADRIRSWLVTKNPTKPAYLIASFNAAGEFCR